MGLCRRARDEAGTTLVELLITIVIMGIGFTTIIGGLGVSVIGSDRHRRQADADNRLRSYAESVKSRYKDCAVVGDYAPPTPDPRYPAVATLVEFSPPPYNAYVRDCRTSLLEPTKAAQPTAFSDSSNAFVIGESPTPLTADATLPIVGTDPDTATLTLDGYDKFLPADAPLSSVVLRVAHRDGPGIDSVAVQIDAMAPISSTGSGCSPGALCLHPDGIKEDRIVLPSSFGFDTVAQLRGLKVAYSAHRGTAAPTATDSLDGIWVEFELRDPPARDSGLQRLTLQVKDNAGRAEQKTQVVVRRHEA